MSTLPVNETAGMERESLRVEHNAPAARVLPEDVFISMLSRERKRTERSRRRFVLMLLESANLLKAGQEPELLPQVLNELAKSMRETDIMGWYEQDRILGVIFTEIGEAENGSVAGALLSKVPNALCNTLRIEQINEINISFHVFPEEAHKNGTKGPTDSALYPDLRARRRPAVKISRLAKRSIDIVGSLLGILALSPLFALIYVLVKLTSKGPALFRQERVGQGGKHFTFLKFRSMYTNCDSEIHREYVKSFIRTGSGKNGLAGTPAVFKLTNDPRITPVGRFLRRYSFDELPQLFNVLGGEMSLVGPRPPLPYEFEDHDIWHRRRLMAVKPGITGLWQVEGRSRVQFDDMIRLDLRYATEWSIWLDLKILLKTPRAVLTADGAY